jgi:hypothetical protein
MDGGALYFPIRLRCAAVSDLLGNAGLEDGLARALGRCFARARSALPVSVALGGGVVLQPPRSTNNGLTGPDAANLLARVQRAIDAAARSQALPIILGPDQVTGRAAPAPVLAEASERFDLARFDASSETYLVPSYKNGKTQVAVNLGRPAKAPPDWSSIAARLRQPASYRVYDFPGEAFSAVYEIRDLALAWDKYAIAMLMLGIRLDGSEPTSRIMKDLRTLARQNPRRFRSLLRELRAFYGGDTAAIERREDEIIILPAGVTLESVRQLYEILGGLVYAAREIPEGRPVAAEWEASARGLGVVAALLAALAETRAKLVRYLLAPLGSPAALAAQQLPPGPPTASAAYSFERTDPDILDSLRQITAQLLRYQGLTLIQGPAHEEQDFVELLRNDLIQNVLWIGKTLDLVQQIDGILQTLREFYGAAADRAEEAKVLRDIRTDILFYATTPLPTAARAAALRARGETRFGDWTGTAADRRMLNLNAQYSKITEQIGKLNYFEARRKFTITTDEEKYNGAFTLLQLGAKDLREEIVLGQERVRGVIYLNSVYVLERRVMLIGARATLLSLWGGTIHAALWANDNEIGDADDRRRWDEETAAIRNEVQAQYHDPDFDTLGSRSQQWFSRLEAVYDDINLVQKREGNRRFLISFAILIVVTVVSGGLAAFEVSAVWAVLGEAATLTLLSAGAEHFILGKRFDIGATVGEFVSNVATFATFRVLNIAFRVDGKLLSPKKAFLLVATTFAANVAVVGAPALLARLETGEWPDHFAFFLASSLLIQTVAGAITARVARMLRELGELQAVQAALKALPDFQSELLALGNEWRAAVTTGTLGKEKFASLQNRTAQLADRTEAGLRRLANLEDPQLEALGIVPGSNAAEIRARLKTMADLMSEYGAAVRAAPNAGQVGQLALPPPEALVSGELVAVGNTREYDPSAPGMDPETLDRLHQAGGYIVKRDGAVLRLFAPGEDHPRYLMLPAGPEMPAPALARLVTPPGPRAAEVLRRSQTNVAKGLGILQAQNAVPSLEAIFTSIAASDPDAAKALLEGLARHFPDTKVPETVLAWKGIAHFLKIGGKPRTLAVVLGLGKDYGTVEVQRALARFTDLRPSDLDGIQAIIALRDETETMIRSRSAMDRIVGIGSGYSDPKSIFAGIGLLSSRTESGFTQLVRRLASSNSADRQQAYEAMVEGIDIVVRSPTRRLRFERRTIGGQEALTVRDAALVRPRGGPAPPSSVYSVTRPSVGDPRVVIRSWISASEARAGLERDMMAAAEYAAAELDGMQRAHSQIPSLGAESGEAIRLASELVNQVLQNRGIEAFLRSLRDQIPNERIHLTTETRTHALTLRLESIHYLVELPEGNRLRLLFEAAIEMRRSGAARAGVRLPGSNNYTFGPWCNP